MLALSGNRRQRFCPHLSEERGNCSAKIGPEAGGFCLETASNEDTRGRRIAKEKTAERVECELY